MVRRRDEGAIQFYGGCPKMSIEVTECHGFRSGDGREMMGKSSGKSLKSVLVWGFRVLALASIGYAIFVAFWCVAHTGRVLYWDQWSDYSAFLTSVDDGEGILRWLFSVHNEHRILLPRLFFLLDWYVFGGSNRFLIFSVFLLQAVCASLVVFVLRKGMDIDRKGNLYPLVIAYVWYVFFGMTQVSNFTWGFQIQFVLVYCLALCAFVAIWRASVSNRGWLWLSLAYVSGFAACFSLANGILVFPVLVFLGWVAKLKRSMLFTSFGVCCGAVFLYALAWNSSNSSVPIEWNAGWFWSLGRYILAFFGNPLRDSGYLFSRAFGLSAIIGWIFCLLLFLFDKRRSRWTLVAVGMTLFVMGSALLTALGRHELGCFQATSSRYATPVLHFWCGFGMLLISPSTIPLGGLGRNMRNMCWGLFGIYIVILTMSQMKFFWMAEQAFVSHEMGFNAIREDSYDRYMDGLYYDLNSARSLFSVIRARPETKAHYGPESLDINGVIPRGILHEWRSVEVIRGESLSGKDKNRAVFRGVLSVEQSREPLFVWFLDSLGTCGTARVIPRRYSGATEEGSWLIQGQWRRIPEDHSVETWIRFDSGFARSRLVFIVRMDSSSVSMIRLEDLQHSSPLHCEVLESQSVWSELSGSRMFQEDNTGAVGWTSFHNGHSRIGSGRVRIVANTGAAKVLYLPIRTGSGIPAYDLKFTGVGINESFLSVGVDALDDQWYAIGIDLTGIALPTRKVEIEVHDRGEDPDQWISIGHLRAH